MTYTATLSRLWIRISAFFLLLTLAFPLHAFAQDSNEQSITTKYFTIYYPAGEEPTAKWYASFADEVNVSVSDLLGAEPVDGLTLRIYASEPEYWRANPMAQIHSGILAHAVPERKEVGVAVERLRQQAPEIARESFRHEMTHIVAAVLSGQNLPIGFHEGLAQYDELSGSRGIEAVQALQAAEAAKVPLLSWTDLNDIDKFRQKMDLAYPQSYAVMAFLADRYGMGAFSRFLGELKRGVDYKEALHVAYGVPIDELERQWREYLPQFLKEGWRTNTLNAYDLSPGMALYNAGRFKEAQQHFTRSEQLFTDLARTEKAKEAADYRLKAEKAVMASEVAGRARQALEAHDYTAAQQSAREASQMFASLSLDRYVEAAKETEDLAKRGLDGIATLEKARDGFNVFRIVEAQREARQAGEAFALLGDAPRVEQANKLLQEMWTWQRTAGMSALGAGVATVLLGTVMALRSRRRIQRRRQPVYLQEEPASWL